MVDGAQGRFPYEFLGSSVEKRFKMVLGFFPFMIKEAEPGRITISPFNNKMMFLDTFEFEAHSQRGATRTFIQRIALPFHTTISQIKSMVEHKIGRFGVSFGALNKRTVPDATQFNFKMLREIIHIVGYTNRL